MRDISDANFSLISLWTVLTASLTMFLITSFQPFSSSPSSAEIHSVSHIVFLTSLFFLPLSFPIHFTFHLSVKFSTASLPVPFLRKKKMRGNTYNRAHKPWIMYGTISLLAIMNMGRGESLLLPPCIYNINVDRRPTGWGQLLLEVYMLPSTKAVHYVLTTTIVNTMMNLLTIILFLR